MKSIDKKAEIQYIEVTGKKGIARLHIGMIKDSVQILVGKPDKTDLRSNNHFTLEDWGYCIKENGLTDLRIEFEDGKLQSAQQD